MAGAVIGSVGVVVRPITTGLNGQLKRAFSGASKGAKGAGSEAGRAYGEGLEGQSQNVVQRFGSGLTSAMGRWAKRGAIAGGAALGVAIGASVVGGFRSAINQQQGQLVLSGLYDDAGKARKTLEGLRGVASGSPIDYSGYQSAAESLAYAGVEGDQAIGVLENVGKAITAAGGDTSNMDRASDALLRGVNAGKFQLDTLQQLSDAGVPILSGLADHFGVSMEQVNTMASNGQVQLDDVLAVMENGTGAIFQQMIVAGESASTSFGNQWKIAKDNVLTAIGGQMVPMLETLAPIVGEVGEKISTWISGLDFTPVTTAITGIVGWVKQLDFSSWKNFTDSLAGGGASSAFSSITDSLAELGPAFSEFVGSLKGSGPALGKLAGGVLGLVADGLSFLAEHMDKIIAALPFILAGFAAWRLAARGQTAALAAQAPLLVLSNGLRLAAATLDLRAASATAANTAAKNVNAAATTRATIAERLRTVATKIGMVATNLAGAAVRAFGVALRFMMGPIGLVIIGITALVAGLVWFFTQTKIGQTIIRSVWTAIQAAISAVVNWLTTVAWPMIQSVWHAIANAALWLWRSVIQPVWTGIKVAIAIAVTAILVYIDLLKWYFNQVIAPVAMWLWNNVMKPVWNGIKTAIGAVVTWFRDSAWPLLSTVITWIATKFDQFKVGLSIIWAFIRNRVIAPVVHWFQNTVWPIINAVIGWIRMAFEGWKIILGAIWGFVKNRIIAPVVAWFRDTAWPLISRVLGYIKTGFTAMKDRLKSIWVSVKNSIIKPVVDWITGTVKPKFDTFTDNVKSAFTTLKDGVLAAWDSIKEGMKKPINGVIGIYNKHIAGNFNDVIETIFGKDGGKKYKLSEMSTFHTGGYTGPGAKYQEAGVVHADEFVVRKESQRSLRRDAPGFLDALNRHGSRALGYADGGLVKLRKPFAGSYPRGDGFGARGGSHKGIDWPMPSGAVLKAVAAGTVQHTRNAAAGNKLNLSIGNGLVAGYHHLSSYIAGQGASVGRGMDIARVGSTGRSSGPHLHFSLKRNGKYVDPAPYLGAGGEAGSGGGSWWNPFSGLWGKIKDKVSSAVGEGTMGGILSGVVENTVGGIAGWVKDKLNIFDWGSDSGGGSGVDRWSDTAEQALRMTGNYSARNLSALLRRMNQESGGNPNAVNDWDVNARNGIPSQGLMQVIPPTFRSYAEPGYGSNIRDPLSNILASINYTMSRYGSLTRGWGRAGGYADGGLVTPQLFDSGGIIPPGLTSVLNASGKPEAVLTNDQLKQLRIIASGRGEKKDGDTFIGYGYTAEDVARHWRKEQQKIEALHGR